MDIKKEQCVKIQEWLDACSKSLQKEKAPKQWSKINSGYIAVIKFLGEAGAEIRYRPPHKHAVKWKAIPREMDVSKYTVKQTEAIAKVLLMIDIYPLLKNNMFVF